MATVIITAEEVAQVLEGATTPAGTPDAALIALTDDANALAVQAAPCLATLADPDKLAAARAILRGAIARWYESSGGSVRTVQVTAGAFSEAKTFDNSTGGSRRTMFWQSEIDALRELCGTTPTRRGRGGAFSINPLADLLDRAGQE